MSLSAVLLAGGKSHRMGQDKATILFRGAPLWQHQLDLLRKLEPGEIFVSARTDPAWRAMDVEFVPDAQRSRGPLSGIAATLARTTTDHLLVLGIDMPFMSADYLRELSERSRPGCGVVPMIGTRAEPLAAIYPRSADVDLRESLSGNDFSLQAVVRKIVASRKLAMVHVSSEQEALFKNLNEPRDLGGE